MKNRSRLLVFSWNITNTKVLAHICTHLFLVFTYSYSFKWRSYKKYKEIPWGYCSVPEISPFAVNLTSNAILYEKCKVLEENIEEVSQHKGDVPSLEWTSPQLMQSHMEGHVKLWSFVVKSRRAVFVCRTEGWRLGRKSIQTSPNSPGHLLSAHKHPTPACTSTGPFGTDGNQHRWFSNNPLVFPAQPVLIALQCADVREEDEATQAPGHAKHPLAKREASKGTFARASQELQAADKAGW